MLWFALAALATTRAALTFVPSMAFWGLNVQRFITATMAWLPWTVAAIVLVPPVARRALPAIEAFGRAITRAPLVTGLIAGIAAAILVTAFPDRLRYVGDFLLRIGAVRQEESPDVLSPQAFPLDVLLHYAAPLQAGKAGWMDPEVAVRWIGAAGAALLGFFAVRLARVLDTGPAARVAAVAVVLFGGYLCLYTGESKAFAEMCVVVVAFAGFALDALKSVDHADGRTKAVELRNDAPRVSRSERGFGLGAGALLGAGLTLAIGVLFHRFALGLLPVWAFLVIRWLSVRRGDTLRSVPALLGIAVPLVVLGAMTPRLANTILTYDLGVNFASPEMRASGGVLGGAFAPSHLLDVLNLLLFLSPLALVAPLLAFAGSRREPASASRPAAREQVLILILVVPFALVMFFARPPQGLVRDWDSFATPAAVFSVAAAWAIARALDRARAPWLAVTVVLAVAAPAVQWLAHYSDAARGRERLEALMLEPPGRPALDRARTWNFLGWRYFRAEQYDASARAFEQATAAAPSPRNLTHWAMAETMLGRHDRALEIYTQAVERDSNLTLGWFGVGVSAINSGDRIAAERAGRALMRLAPENPKTREILEYLRGRQTP